MSAVIKIGKHNVIVNIWQKPQSLLDLNQSASVAKVKPQMQTSLSGVKVLLIVCPSSAAKSFFYNLKSRNNSRPRFLVFQNGKHTNVTASIMSVTRKWFNRDLRVSEAPFHQHTSSRFLFWHFIIVIGFFTDATLLYVLVLTLLSVQADTTVLREAYHLHFQTYCNKFMDLRSVTHQMKSWFSCRHGLILWPITLFFYKLFSLVLPSPSLFPLMFNSNFTALCLGVNSTSALVGSTVCCTHVFALSQSLILFLSVFLTLILAPSLSVHVVRPSQFKIRFKLQDWLWLSVVPSEFLPTRNLAFNGILPCCWT